ncbi:MAG TPA: serine hydrolase domain-containing protein [Planctomycetota bacterium]|nr:serine hydrolase domain-containing protein [Planctomycetota bacterium]
MFGSAVASRSRRSLAGRWALLTAVAVHGWGADNDLVKDLAPFVEKHAVAGAVCAVATKAGLKDVEAIGWADIAAKKAMTTDALFWIASMSKPMTATAFMMLMDEGKVILDDPVEKYLPEFRGQMVLAEQDDDHRLLKKPMHPITVRNILSHTSGLPFSSRIETPKVYKADLFPLQVAATSYAMTPLNREPDSHYDYSNAGINTAGRIIEVVSGLPYEQFMEQRLLKPLGMSETTFWPNEAQSARVAKSYRPNAAKDDLDEIQVDQLTYPLSDAKRRPLFAGGYFSTAHDMAVFGTLILNGGVHDGKRLVSEASIRQLTSTQAGAKLNDESKPSGYGLGFSTTTKSTGDTGPVPVGACGHGGAYATNLWIDPAHGVVLIYLVQHAGFINDGNKAKGVFEKAAIEQYGTK